VVVSSASVVSSCRVGVVSVSSVRQKNSVSNAIEKSLDSRARHCTKQLQLDPRSCGITERAAPPVAVGVSLPAAVRPMRDRATLSGSHRATVIVYDDANTSPAPRAQLEEPGYARKPSSSVHYVLPTSRGLRPRDSK
jgi:hypothetical protein